jgi:hypothetical protein
MLVVLAAEALVVVVVVGVCYTSEVCVNLGYFLLYVVL